MKMRNKSKDLKKLADAFYKNLEITPWEYGGIGLDPKRPFGNSDVPEDMLKIIEWKKEGRDDEGPCYTDYQIEYVDNLYKKDLIPFLRRRWFERDSTKKIVDAKINSITVREQAIAVKAIRYLKDLKESLNKPVAEFAQLVKDLDLYENDDE